MKKKRWQQELDGLLSLVLFVVCVSLVFRSVELSLMVTAAMGVHELGHILAVSRFGIDWQVGFGVAGAWTMTPLKERQALGHFANSLIHLAGPFFNILYALLALGIHCGLVRDPSFDYWPRLANMSAMVGLMNLLPMMLHTPLWLTRAHALIMVQGLVEILDLILSANTVVVAAVGFLLIVLLLAYRFRRALIAWWNARGERLIGFPRGRRSGRDKTAEVTGGRAQ